MQTNHRLPLNKFKPIAQFPHKKIQIDYHHFNSYLKYWRCNSLQKILSSKYTTKLSYRVPNPKTYLIVCTNKIIDTKRNATKTTIQSTLEYKTEINEAGVKNLRKVGYMGLQRYIEKHS